MSSPAKLDGGRLREAWASPPENYAGFGIVGHVDQTPAFARIEAGQALVEVTLVPSGDEVVARLDGAAGDGGGWYIPLAYGTRVVLTFPGGTGSEPVIIGRVSDTAWPFPTDVCGIAIPPAGGAPQYSFLKTPTGQMLAIETGDGGDVLVHSGGSIEMRAPAGEQILLGGRTHIGATFTTPPVGAVTGPNGETLPGVQGAPYVPIPYVGVPAPPLAVFPPFVGPADGLVRAKDQVQSDAGTDPAFWTAFAAICAFCLVPVPPIALTSWHKGASQHTASDT